ncbi:MAG: fuculose phosphate aldolase [Deltaproteobacteria bacterium RIFOXYA12_FULL_58_15]|nr:MAG: fuculose phosphate aldolase [Deltaproteobacteria bacterium RIFOXYA12_FULL_58_15]
MQHRLLRQEIIDTARKMNAAGINQGMSGNLSVRLSDRFLITPSGMSYDGMRPEDVVEMSLDGRVIGMGKPSSEWLFHRDIYGARYDVNVVLHAHPKDATAIACLRRDIPAFHYMVAVAGGDSIRCAPYATYGTQELSNHAIAALIDRRACLLANHGVIVLGDDLSAALDLAIELEALAAQYLRALQVGEPVLLTAAEMAEVFERFASYRGGHKRQPSTRGY